jgi:lipopolysaccharide/colanic/teichoic acid biosynthesis glycosyltransferase
VYFFFKRILDIIISLAAVFLLLPFFIPIIIALRLTGEGEIFYFQKRIGQHQRYFKLWKFATMLKNSPGMGSGMITLRDDPRVTPVGKWLRKTKLNELPQIINVLLGDMSLVGPRPLVDATFSTFSPEFKSRFYQMKPGVTGIGSIIFRDEEKLISESSLPALEYYRLHIAPYKGALELWYQEHASVSTDLFIIFLTAWQIFFPESRLVYRIFRDLPDAPSGAFAM